jgi:hypothetical protein
MDNTPLIQPKIISSPFSGSPIRPRILTRTTGNKIYTEAHYTCPDSGRFVMKGIVKVEDVKK